MADLEALESEMRRRGLLPAVGGAKDDTLKTPKGGWTKEQLMQQEESNPDPLTAQSKELSTWEKLATGSENTLKQRALGLAQIVTEAAGNEDSPYYKDMQDLAGDYKQAGNDAGLVGILGGMAVDPATWALAPVALGGGVMNLAKAGFVGGGTSGFTSPTEKSDSRAVNTMRDAAIGTVAAPVIGGVAGKLGQWAGAAGDKVIDETKASASKLSDYLKTIIQPDEMTIAAEIKAGISPSDAIKAVEGMGQEVVELVKNGLDSGLSPEVALLNAKARSKGINLTADVLTQDPKLQARVDLGRQNAVGEDAYKVVTDIDKANKAALILERDRIGNLVASGGDSGFAALPLKEINETSVASQIGDAVRKRASELKTPAQEAYKAGLETKSQVSLGELKSLAPELKKQLADEGFKGDLYPIMNQYLKKLDKFAKAPDAAKIGYRELEIFKKELYNATKATSNESEKVALDKIHSAYKDKLDSLIDNDLLVNPDDAAKILRNAPSMWRDYQKTIFGSDGKNAIGAIVKKNLNDRAIANIFSSSTTGSAGATKAIRELQKAIGSEAPELGNLRAQFFNRIIGGGLGEASVDVTATNYGAKVLGNVKQFRTKNKELYDELFTPDMQSEIQDFAEILKLQTNKIRSSVNPSNTAIMNQQIQNGMNRLLSRFGAHGDVIGGVIKTLGDDLGQAKNAKEVIKAVTDPLSAIGNRSDILSALGRGVGRVSGAALPAEIGAKTAQPLPDVPEFRMPVEYMPQQENDTNELEQEMRRRGLLGDEQAPQGNAGNDTLSQATPTFTQANEGRVLTTYLDTEGNRTIGDGFNFNSGIAAKVWKQAGIKTPFREAYLGKQGITEQEAQALYNVSNKIATDDARAVYKNYDRLSASQQEALRDLAYHHGLPSLKNNLKGFNHAINSGRLNVAIKALSESTYASKFPSRKDAVINKLIGG